MTQIAWSDALSLGLNDPECEAIDEQHQQLIEIANALLAAYKEERGEAAVDAVIYRLREYTVTHFKAEETLMRSAGYPHLLQHQKQHADLISQVKTYQYAKFYKEKVSLKELKALLSDWLLTHILDHDMRFARYLRDEKGRN